MPVNLPTHGHGQGWADLNFLIPELLSEVQYRKGPYCASEGDFSLLSVVSILAMLWALNLAGRFGDAEARLALPGRSLLGPGLSECLAGRRLCRLW